MSIEIVEGGYYKDRMGTVCGPMIYRGSGHMYPWLCETTNGSFAYGGYNFSDHEFSSYDLIERVNPDGTPWVAPSASKDMESVLIHEVAHMEGLRPGLLMPTYINKDRIGDECWCAEYGLVGGKPTVINYNRCILRAWLPGNDGAVAIVEDCETHQVYDWSVTAISFAEKMPEVYKESEDE